MNEAAQFCLVMCGIAAAYSFWRIADIFEQIADDFRKVVERDKPSIQED